MRWRDWNWFRFASIMAPVTLVLVVLLIYGQSLSHQLVWDDEENIKGNPTLRQSIFSGEFLASTAAPTRVLTNLSFAVEYRAWGLDPFGYHATNLALHLINTLLVFSLMLCLMKTRDSRPGELPRHRPSPLLEASVAGMLFAAHPVHVETVNSVALGRGYLLATMFGLLAIVCVASIAGAAQPAMEGGKTSEESPYGPGRLNGIARRPRWTAKWAWTCACVAALFSLVSHEIGAIVIVLIGWFWLQRRPSSRIRTLARMEHIVLIAIGTSLVLVLFWTLGGAEELARRLAPTPAVMVLMVRQLLAAVPLCIWYDSSAVGTPDFLGPFTAVVLVVALLLVWMTYVRPDATVRLSIMLAALALTPILIRQLTPFPSPSVLGERWLYLPSALFSLWIGSLVGLGWRAQVRGNIVIRISVRAIVSFLVVLLLGGAVYSAAEVSHWRTNVRLFSHAVQSCPPSAYLHSALGKYYYDEGEEVLARKEFLAANTIDPLYPRARIGLGILALAEGHATTAWREFSLAIQKAPYDPDARNGLGTVYFWRGQYDEAIREFQQAIALRPSVAGFHWNLAMAYMQVDELEGAIQEWQQVIAVSPDAQERQTALEQIALIRRIGPHQGPMREE